MRPILKITGLGLVLSAALLILLSPFPGQPAQPASHVAAQDGADNPACDSLITEAVERVANVCIGMGVNEACLGYPTVSAVLANPDAIFEARGDIVPVTDLETIITRPIDPDTGEWGIVLMDIQADLPDDADGTVRLLLFGGAELEPATDVVIDNRPTCTVTNDGPNNLNLRTGPDTVYPAVDVFDRGDTIRFYGRNPAGSWLLSNRGWVYAPLTTPGCDVLNELPPISNASEQYVAPMQSFTLRMDETAQCSAAPTGMMVQTPAGETANLMVNNVELRIGSTAFIRLENNNQQMTVANLAGNVEMNSGGKSQPVPPGGQVSVPLNNNENGDPTPNGPPGNPQPMSNAIQNTTPQLFNTLDDPIDLPDVYTPPPGGNGDTGPGPGNGGPGNGDTPPGEWGACGSCAGCGGPDWQCVTSPDGQCVWDAAACDPAASEPVYAIAAPDVSCDVYDEVNITATYSSNDGATLDPAPGIELGYDAGMMQLTAGPDFSATTITFQFYCAEVGLAEVFLAAMDSAGREVTTTFKVEIIG